MSITIKIKKDYRGLKENEEFVFDKDITIIVGSNGSGKSSLINLLRSQWKGHYMGRIDRKSDLDELCSVEGLDEFVHKYDYATDTDSLAGKSFVDMSYLTKDKGLGITVMRFSAGQTQLAQLNNIISKIATTYKEGEKQLVIFDEPEKGLDLKTQYKFASAIRNFKPKLNTTCIVITHSLPFLDSFGSVYDMDTRSIMSTDELITTFLK
jgi:ABC-type multidrug transport system ATPase subunit